MDGVHDCGGVEGYGPVETEPEDAPKFYEGWERETFGLYWAVNCLGYWPEEAVRHSVERMGAIEYLTTPYYEHWLASMEMLLREHGHITSEELESKQDEIRSGRRKSAIKALIASFMPRDVKGESEASVLDADMVDALLKEGDCYRMDIEVPAKFKVGDRIRALDIRPEGHTRLTQYIRGKVGVIMRDHGVYPFPDTTIRGDTKAQHVYSVQFRAQEVWGQRAPATDSLCIDLWDDYLVSIE